MLSNLCSLIAVSSVLLLASTASAQSIYTPPDSCVAIIDDSQRCGSQDLANNPTDKQYRSFFTCFCQDPGLDAIVSDCISNLDTSETVGQGVLRTIQTVNALCARLANLFDSSSSSDSGTATSGSQSSAPITTGPQPTDTDLPGADQCGQLGSTINSCGAVAITDLAVPDIARCICGDGSGSQFSGLVTQCFNYLSVASPTVLGSFETFTEGYCNGFESATASGGSSMSTSAANTGANTDTGPSQTQAGVSSSSGTQSVPAETSTPGAASTLQIAFGSVLFCFFGVVALVL
ncbi:hypothetical protein AA313_de0209177 [Arthrobotrys entomopaga]|nr:hypothetical protein AA313_de0209177 [Arthrobotrys entomopaga]